MKEKRKDNKKRKEVKIVKIVKPKIRVIGEEDEGELEENVDESKKGRIGQKIDNGREISEMASVDGFRSSPIILETGEERPRGEIENATREKRRFDNEEAIKERRYATGRRQVTQRDSYESAYYAAGGGTAGVTPGREISADRTIEQRQAIRTGGAIRPSGAQGSEGREEKYQTQGGQQKRKRYPWEV